MSIGKIKQLLFVQCFVFLYYPGRYKMLTILLQTSATSVAFALRGKCLAIPLSSKDFVEYGFVASWLCRARSHLTEAWINQWLFYCKKIFLFIKLSLETEGVSSSLLTRFPRISWTGPSGQQWAKNAEHSGKGQGRCIVLAPFRSWPLFQVLTYYFLAGCYCEC